MKRPKLYYVPGLISLLALPVIVLMLLPEEPVPPTCITMYLPQDKKPTGEIDFFSKYVVLDAAEGKHITQVEFWNWPNPGIESYIYQSKLAFLHQEIVRLNIIHDTMTVLKIELGDGFYYGDFIGILNTLLLNRVKRYALVDNSFYIFTNPRPADPSTSPPIEALLNNDVISFEHDFYTPEEEISAFTAFKNFLTTAFAVIKQNFLMIAGFIGFILLPFLYRLFRPFRPNPKGNIPTDL